MQNAEFAELPAHCVLDRDDSCYSPFVELLNATPLAGFASGFSRNQLPYSSSFTWDSSAPIAFALRFPDFAKYSIGFVLMFRFKIMWDIKDNLLQLI